MDMKLVFKEWLKCPKAFVLLISYVILRIIEFILSTQIIVIATRALDSPLDFKKNLITIIIFYIIINISSAISIKCLVSARADFFYMSTLNFVDKILDSDVGLFTKYSESNVLIAHEAINNIIKVMVESSRVLINLSRLVITFVTMYSIIGLKILFVFIIYFIGFISLKLIFKKMGSLDKGLYQVDKERSQLIENSINGFNEIRTFNITNHYKKLIKDLSDKGQKLVTDKGSARMKLSLSIDISEMISVILIVLFSANEISKGSITAASGISLIGLLYGIIDPIMYIADVLEEISIMSAKIPDYNKIIEYPNNQISQGSLNYKFDSEIKINNVSFGYEDNDQVINNINIAISKGQKVGICGISGGGKTTIFKLLNRLYEPNSGSITIDGVDIKDIKIDEYRSHLSTVHQDSIIFPMTILENIRFAKVGASDEEVIDAARKASLYEFVDSLPDKFNTVVGPRGLKLSGGQRQRIALARLFLVNPEIILLDEATSALDNNSETFIQDEIMKMEGKTIIAIAHRLSTIKDFDVIYVLDKDGIVESGNHQELIEKDGAYAALNK